MVKKCPNCNQPMAMIDDYFYECPTCDEESSDPVLVHAKCTVCEQEFQYEDYPDTQVRECCDGCIAKMHSSPRSTTHAVNSQ